MSIFIDNTRRLVITSKKDFSMKEEMKMIIIIGLGIND